MYQNNIKDFAWHGLKNGINVGRKAVEGTIGGAGKKAIVRKEFYPYYISTKDAFSIIQAIKCEDPLEKQAIDMLRDATDSMNKIAKDGRTAMCILADEILQQVALSGTDTSEAEKEINKALPLIEKEIDKQTKKIDVDEIEKVATTASNSPRIGKLIGEIYKKQGKECIINYIEGSGTLEDYVIYHDGVRFQGTGFLTESFAYDPIAKKANRAEKVAIHERPKILVTKRKITTDDEISPLLDALHARGEKTLIIFTQDMDARIVTDLVNTHKSGIMNICIIKAPVLWTEYVFEDFAKVVGATIVEDATGVTFKNLDLEHLGTCDKIVVDSEETIINGGVDISEHISYLKSKGDDDSMRRVWWLTAKTATLRLGATNEGELSNLRLAAQDAVYSSQAALQHGVVAGGGLCLWGIANNTKSPVFKSLLSLVLQGPLKQIAKNARMTDLEFIQQIPSHIVDSSLVIKNSVRNAIKIASIILGTSILVDIPKKTMEELQLEIIGRQRGPFQ